MRYVLRWSLPALVFAAAWCVLNAGAASAQSIEQATPACSATGPYGYAAPALAASVTCQISVPDQELTENTTLFIQPAQYAGLDPLSCNGVDGASYATQAISNAVPFAYGGQFSGSAGCAFQVTAGVVPPGYPVGSFSLAVPSGALQVQTLLCGDPSCGTSPGVAYDAGGPTYYPPTPPVIYAPQTSVYTPPPPALVYSPPVVSYTPPPADNDHDRDDGSWHDPHGQGDGGQWQDPHHDSGRWQDPRGSGASSGQSSAGQPADPNHHHDDQGNGGSNQHHDDGSAGSGSGSGGGSGSGSDSHHHKDDGTGH